MNTISSVSHMHPTVLKFAQAGGWLPNYTALSNHAGGQLHGDLRMAPTAVVGAVCSSGTGGPGAETIPVLDAQTHPMWDGVLPCMHV